MQTNPNWYNYMVSRNLPENMKELDILAKNLWWCWNEPAKGLFKSIDPVLWSESDHNPLALLDSLTLSRLKELSKDAKFMKELKAVTAEFNNYMALKNERKGALIAYLCMEYGLDTSLKIYSGGLGILAGDYLKESSDMNVNMVAIGLLYRYGYFSQKLSAQGDQIADYEAQQFLKTPASPVYDEKGEWVRISIPMSDHELRARVWKVAVGRTDLYLLDTDYEENRPEDRGITNNLYGGDWECRIKQEMLLGIGGIKVLRALGLNAEIYHCNEGHAAFNGLERLREYIADGLSLDEAIEAVRCSALFTTHTPVPAGHDAFDDVLMGRFLGYMPAALHTDWYGFMKLGKIDAANRDEKFSMSVLASKLSQEVNGVSWLHGLVSQEILSDIWPGFLPEELHVSSVTNGVHYPTWCAPEWKLVHEKVFGPEFKTSHYDKSCFDGIYNIDDAEVWAVRKELRKELIKVVKRQLSKPLVSAHYTPRQVIKIKETLRDDILTIGFARRFATYKRAHLLFTDLNRLNEIVNNPKHPVQFLFAGKAHPADKAGQDLIKQIVEISKRPEFIGKIVFVPNYDIHIAKRLVQGVDVWMNNPTRPLEASGTSGEKAAMNGVMHFSVLDGWWVEGYKEGCGWALPMEQTYEDTGFQNELDAATIYSIIENEIAPAFYNVDRKTGRSAEWISYIKNTIAKVASNFTTNRMLTDYVEKYYEPLAARTERLHANGFAECREIASWKNRVRAEWDKVQVRDINAPATYTLLGESIVATVDVFIGNLNPEEIGVEAVFTTLDDKGKHHVARTHEFTPGEKGENGVVTYTANFLPENTGSFQVAGRIFAKNPALAHRQDFELVRWL